VTRAHNVDALVALAGQLGSAAAGTEWYLFGSMDREEKFNSDIDLLILCGTAAQADALRAAIDPDQLGRPIDLSLITYDEEREIGAVALQAARKIYP
jgi:predicted nucleotidyltransferase